MAKTIRASDISLHDLETQFDLQLNNDEHFFSDWQAAPFPELTDFDKTMKISFHNGI